MKSGNRRVGKVSWGSLSVSGERNTPGRVDRRKKVLAVQERRKKRKGEVGQDDAFEGEQSGKKYQRLSKMQKSGVVP